MSVILLNYYCKMQIQSPLSFLGFRKGSRLTEAVWDAVRDIGFGGRGLDLILSCTFKNWCDH